MLVETDRVAPGILKKFDSLKKKKKPTKRQEGFDIAVVME